MVIYSEEINFKYIQGEHFYGADTDVYRILGDLNEESWISYCDEMAGSGTTVEYDSAIDKFRVCNFTGV